MYDLAGGMARATDESGSQRIGALGEIILPVSAQYDGRHCR